MVQELVIAIGLLALLGFSAEAGFRYSRRVAARDGAQGAGGVIGAIQAAMLGILGLLLGFSFAAATSRFLERQDLIVTEANAIGTAYLRADMLDEPHRSELRKHLADYVKHRLAVSTKLRRDIAAETAAEVSTFHENIWKAAQAGAAAKPETMVVVLPSVNDVIDLHTTRVAAGRKHLPIPIMGLLLVCSALAMGIVGYGCGVAGRRYVVLVGPLAILVTVLLWIIIDFDHPRDGLIQLNDWPLRDLNLQ